MRALLLALVLLLPLGAVRAQVAVPPLNAPVTDLSGTLTQAQIDALDAKLLAFNRARGSQIAVLLVPTTQPETIEQYSIRVVEQWKLGRKGTDDGVLLLAAMRDRAVRIEVGYGLEGTIPDAVARRVVDEVVVPRFRNRDYAGGIDAGVDRLMALIQGQALPPPPQQHRAPADDGGMQQALVVLFGALFAGRVLRAALGRLLGAGATAALAAGACWLMSASLLVVGFVGLLAFAATLLGFGGWGGGWGGPGGGWGGGRGGDGGFRGGDGGFGGGGASGRW